MTVVHIPRPFKPNAKQREFLHVCSEPGAQMVLIDGAIRSGKSQVACAQIVEWGVRYPGTTSLVARLTYRELEDTCKKMLLRGDGGLPPILHPQLVAKESVSDNKVTLRNGSEILFRSLEPDNISKALGPTYSAVFLDQAEELDSGPAGERLFDTLLGRLSEPFGPRKMLVAANPGPTTHWLFRRFVDPQKRQPRARRVHVTLQDNAGHLPADYLANMVATKDTRPHWYRTYVLGEWGSFEGAAYEEFSEDIHVVIPFAIPAGWERIEGMDHGTNNPTAWLITAADYDGSLVLFDEYYAPGLVSTHAAEVLRRRDEWWWPKDKDGNPGYAPVFGDPSIRNRYGLSDTSGRELSVAVEYADHGIGIVPGQNDRRAGYARIRELLHPDPERFFPDWHPRQGDKGAPRLFIFNRCANTIEQLRSAPVKAEGADAQDIVDPAWESQHGHAHAALRYLTMSRPLASEKPVEEPDVRTLYADYDPNEARLARIREIEEQDAPSEVLLYDGY